eukprot:scaffold17854_cov124-Isochrysis_galbana.AAC.5
MSEMRPTIFARRSCGQTAVGGRLSARDQKCTVLCSVAPCCTRHPARRRCRVAVNAQSSVPNTDVVSVNDNDKTPISNKIAIIQCHLVAPQSSVYHSADIAKNMCRCPALMTYENFGSAIAMATELVSRSSALMAHSWRHGRWHAT